MSSLPLAPDTPLDESGEPRIGTYRGGCSDTDLSGANRQNDASGGPQFLREKQWQWFAVANPRIACGGTLLDAGYATTLFLWAFDRTTRRMIDDRTELLPPFAIDISDNPGDGGGAQLRGLRRSFDIDRDGGTIRVDADVDEMRFELEIDATCTEALTAICPVGTGDRQGVNVTQKQNCLPVTGRVSVDGRSFKFGDESVAMLDYTHGLLSRETRWRWAIAGGFTDEGVPIGFNFVEGFNGELENAVWMDGDLRTTEPVSIDFDEDRPDEPWNLRSQAGGLDLSMFVEGVRTHETNLRIVSSSYLQPLGRWHGRIIDREIHDLFGISERHYAKW